jgi:uncharacterized Ntn-hydrolase superfamily protein
MRFKRLLASITPLLLAGTASAAEPAPQYNEKVLGTRSIVACDAGTQACGIAVLSFPSAVGALVPYGRPGVAVASQLYPTVDVSEALVARVSGGEEPQAALDALMALDPGRDVRQFGVAALGPDGSVRVAQYTGAFPWPHQCAVKGATFAVQASAQTSPEVCRAMAEGFEQATGSLPYRLLAALKAGGRVGGDQRGEPAGAIRVWSGVTPISGFTHVMADSVVYGSPSAIAELEKNLDRYVGQSTPPHPEDAVVLDARTTRSVQRALRKLAYYAGPADGVWTAEVEAAFNGFQANNVFFPKPVVVDGGVRKADGPLLRFLLNAERGTLVPAPRP